MLVVFFFKQKTAYEMRISDWSSDVCSSDLAKRIKDATISDRSIVATTTDGKKIQATITYLDRGLVGDLINNDVKFDVKKPDEPSFLSQIFISWFPMLLLIGVWVFFMRQMQGGGKGGAFSFGKRSEEHTSELQSLMRISYAVFCLKKKKEQND